MSDWSSDVCSSDLVRMLGGTFEIDSAPGGPTILTFALPRVSPDDRSAFR